MGQYKNQSTWGKATAKARYADGGAVVLDTKDQNVIDPEKYVRNKEVSSDPRNIYDDQGNIVDYDMKDHSKKKQD